MIDCEVRYKNPNNYSFQILSNILSNKVLARLDEGNGTHRNNCKDIPLDQQMVTTPHFINMTQMAVLLRTKQKN